MGSWIRDSNFVLFVVNGLINGEIEKPSGQFLGLICDESLTCWGLNSNLRHFNLFYLYLYPCGESCLLVSWCVSDRCGMADSDKNHGRSRRPSAENRGWSHRLGSWWRDDWEVWWCRVRSTPCTKRCGARVSWLNLKTKVDDLSVLWPQNHWDSFLWLGLKTDGDGFLQFGLKTCGDGFSPFGLKTDYSGFPVWASKPIATV
jgi:hypothetical protein